MRRYVSGFATVAAAAAVSVALFGGAAQAGDPKDHDGASGSSGTATATCEWMLPLQEGIVIQCTASGGAAGADGWTVEY